MMLLAVMLMAALGDAGNVDAAARSDACAIGEAARSDFDAQVPFEVVDGRIYVQARVNGRGPFRFAVDTGASGRGRADATLVAVLGLEVHGSASTSDGLESTVVDTTRLESLALGGLSRHDLEVITRDYSRLMSPEAPFLGILGRGFFEDGLLVIDYPRRMLSFSRSLVLPAGGDSILEYERPFRVSVSIGDVRTEGNIDTGANVAFLMPQALYGQLEGTPLEPAGAGGLTNGRIETMRGVIRGPVRIGAASIEDAEVRVSDRYPELLVGAHALQGFVILVDQRSKRVALCPPASPGKT